MDNPFYSPAVLSICPGFLGLERGLQRAIGKISVVAYLEIEAFIIANLIAGMQAGVLDAAPVWTDVKTFDPKPFRGKIHGILGGYPCFSAGMLILTINGYRPIEEIKIGDIVLTHLGRWRKVTQTMQKEDAELYTISSQGSPNINTTAEHPFYARRCGTKWNNEKRMGQRDFKNPEWIKARNLKHSFTSQILPVEKRSELSESLWWVIGRYLADGWMQKSPSHGKKGRIIICSAKKEGDFLEEKLREGGFNPYRVDERTTTKFHITRQWFYELLQNFGRYSHGKYLPGFALELNKACSRSLLDGYLSGDGHIEKSGEKRATTVSKKLAYSMALLAQRAYGIVASIRKNTPNRESRIEGRMVNERETYIISIPTTNRSAVIENGYGWKLVRKCDQAGIGKVYNIAVEEDESYVVENCIVHNCQPFSLAGQRKGHEDPRHLWPHIHGIVKTTEPVWCFFENVSGHLSMGFDQVYKDLRGLGYSVEAGVFTAEEVGAPHERERLFILAISERFLSYTRREPARWKAWTNINWSGQRAAMEFTNSGERGLAERQSGQERNSPISDTDTIGTGKELPNAGGRTGWPATTTGLDMEREELCKIGRNENTNGLESFGETELGNSDGRRCQQCNEGVWNSIHFTCERCESMADTNRSGSIENPQLSKIWTVGVKQPSGNSGIATTGKDDKERQGKVEHANDTRCREFSWAEPVSPKFTPVECTCAFNGSYTNTKSEVSLRLRPYVDNIREFLFNRTVSEMQSDKIRNCDFHGWPAGPGSEQYEWEEPRTIKPKLGSAINGYNFREDLLRAYGNSVVEQTAEIAFLNLLQKHLKNIGQ